MRAGIEQRPPQRLRALGRAEHLVADLAGVPGARDPAALHAADRDRLRDEAEVAQAGHVGIGQSRQELARPRPLHLEVRKRKGLLLDLDVHVGADAAEVIGIRVEGGDDQHVVLGLAAIADAVAEHLPVLVAERPVPALPHLERRHVRREDPVGRAHRIRPLEEPLAKWGLVPDPDRLADGVMLRHGIAEVGDPVPPLPLGERPAHPPLDLVERGLKQTLRSDRRCRWGHLDLERRGRAPGRKGRRSPRSAASPPRRA